ncbi:hypothetical protein LDENG_00115990 [Lucifuga dentata]|nr:hypothetical protein LDENG_00115990 [Lucifuga dentata]
MPKKKGAKGTKVTLKMATKAVQLTAEGQRRLSLKKMGIITFPKCLFKLTNMNELDLSCNLIKKLPDDIGSFSSLRRLDLHSNKLEAVPESISKLEELTHLNLSNNCLTSAGLPSALGSLTNLKSLNLGMNQLDALPSSLVALTNLEELSLFDNLFTKQQEVVNVLSRLTKLDMKRNPLSVEMPTDHSEPEEEMYLVNESSLCQPCLKKCEEQRGRQKRTQREEEPGEEVLEEKRQRTYSGLASPNSVAKFNQDVWRRRRQEQEQ